MGQNKIKFGCKRAWYALYDEDNKTYGTLKRFPGAVNFNFTTEGGDFNDFYADDGVYYTFAGSNGGYTAELEVAMITDEIKRDLLGEELDDGTGVQFEFADAEPKQFGFLFETSGDTTTAGFSFYNCKASRPELTASTMTDSTEPDTDTLSVRIAAVETQYKGEERPLVKGFIEKKADNAAKYTAFFNAITLPTAAA